MPGCLQRRPAVLLLVGAAAFAPTACGEDAVDVACNEAVGLGLAFVPFAGAAHDLACAFANNDPGAAAWAVLGGTLDAWTLGTARIATSTAKLVRAGTKGHSLVKAARVAKGAKRAQQTFEVVDAACAFAEVVLQATDMKDKTKEP